MRNRKAKVTLINQAQRGVTVWLLGLSKRLAHSSMIFLQRLRHSLHISALAALATSRTRRRPFKD
jgi:hypothetical protein